VNIDGAAEAIIRARLMAEKMAGVEIRGVCAGVSGAHIRSFNSRGVVAIPNSKKEVSTKDVVRVTEAAKSITLPYDREIIHTIPQDFVVDDQDGVRDPVGMSAMRLEADIHIITGHVTQIDNLAKVIRKAGLEVVDLVFEPVATAKAVLTEEERDSGSLLVDMGGGVTSYALYHGGCIRLSGAVPVGGAQLTGDLAVGLRTTASVAEGLKREYGIALPELAGDEETVMVPGVGSRKAQEVRRQIVAAIIEPRCEEIFTMVKDAVASEKYYRMLGGGIVLTGGGSKIRGMVEVAEQVFDLPARVASPIGLEGLAEIVYEEGWSACVGLLVYGRDSLLADMEWGGAGKQVRRIIGRLKRMASLF
ncbi:MAG: cell division protein FtsA, partial [Candidatus Krumholzibacteria bacterium]|nr:cell division protein FtsA [Candidatus Krumholzibacteria bacterium]